MKKYDYITNDMFQERLDEIAEEAGVHELMDIPGVRELVSEHFNNDVLESFDDERDEPQRVTTVRKYKHGAELEITSGLYRPVSHQVADAFLSKHTVLSTFDGDDHVTYNLDRA